MDRVSVTTWNWVVLSLVGFLTSSVTWEVFLPVGHFNLGDHVWFHGIGKGPTDTRHLRLKGWRQTLKSARLRTVRILQLLGHLLKVHRVLRSAIPVSRNAGALFLWILIRGFARFSVCHTFRVIAVFGWVKGIRRFGLFGGNERGTDGEDIRLGNSELRLFYSFPIDSRLKV